MKAHNSSLFIAAFAALASVGCNHGGASGGDLAVVNGEAISMDEFHKYLERKPAVQVQTPQGPAELKVVAPLGFQAMRDLINRRILLEVAQDEKVMPTDDEVKKELAFQMKQIPTFMQTLTAQGLTPEDIRRDLTLDLAKNNIIEKGITVTPADVDAFIKANPDKFLTPEEARLRLVQVSDQATKDQVDKALAAGQPFGQVALTFSRDPNVRRTQGVYQQTQVAAMAPALQTIVRNTAQGKTSDWIPDNGQFVKILVEQKAEPKKITIDDTVRENVRRSLALERGSQATNLAERLVKKLREAKITVTPPELKTLWDSAIKDLQESDAQTKTPTANGAPATPAPTTAGATTAGK